MINDEIIICEPAGCFEVGNIIHGTMSGNWAYIVGIVGSTFLISKYFREVIKQFKMHPQSRNPICWTIERMFA